MRQLKKWIKRYFSGWLYRKALQPARFQALASRVASATSVRDAAGDLFTYHGEDGIIQYLLNQVTDIPPVFVDIGAGDCIKGNCATLAVHQQWKGLFIDADPFQIGTGRSFYARVLPAAQKRLQFLARYARPDTINNLLLKSGLEGAVGLLSIDIDGNDYWIWEALDVIQPMLVVIEAKVEFGLHNVVVPYSNKNHPSFDRMNNGASVTALRNLGRRKGYVLVASNPQGYNLFFLRKENVRHPLRELTPDEVLQSQEAKDSFYKDRFFEAHEFIRPE
ncbi:MAG TPA: hypothetical protein VHK91_15165 [Flavisolibacter sp.]|jgi:hypothetical protein|nr:hypothetical protein [Flavisolibacter sp.]